MEMITEIGNKINAAPQALDRELQWLSAFLDHKFESYFKGEEGIEQFEIPLPDLSAETSPYANLINKFDFGVAERLALCLALAPHLQPELLDLFFTVNPQLNRPFTEFGGYTGKDHTGFLPTGQTLAFLMTRGSIQERPDLLELFSTDHPFATEGILSLERIDQQEPLLSGRLLISDEFLHLLTGGGTSFSVSVDVFPAKQIQTAMEWEDLVLSPFVMEDLSQIKTWVDHEKGLMEDPVFHKHIKPGFRSLFYGPPGTGKTLAASLLGKTCGLDVYRVDLSLIVSKYIGETEKNLAKVFDYAEKRNWILFFDEADALFGKRTSTQSSNDRFANQEVAFLLQRIEDFPGVVILASNLKSNMDEAFSRRFQSTVFFPMPDANQRLLLWQKMFSGKIQPAPSCDLSAIAEKYELSGGSMINVLRYSTLKTVQKGASSISEKDILGGIRKEFQKYGRTI